MSVSERVQVIFLLIHSGCADYCQRTRPTGEPKLYLIARDLAREVLGADAILSWEGSPQGLIQDLQGRDGQAAIFLRDEYSGLIQQMNRASGHMGGLAQMF